MNKKKLILLFALIVLQLSVMSTMFIKSAYIKNYAIKNNTIFRLRCTAYDPFHPLKGRYAQLNLEWDDIKEIENRLGYSLKNVYDTINKYYLQEEYALSIEALSNNDFNALEPVLEIYVGKDGTCVQKELYVHVDGTELTVEDYIRNK
ncbi:MAG: hypothetical protein IKI31_06930 [Treponema sp.]|nr:hypothetical protein [Treponema sp.]